MWILRADWPTDALGWPTCAVIDATGRCYWLDPPVCHGGGGRCRQHAIWLLAKVLASLRDKLTTPAPMTWAQNASGVREVDHAGCPGSSRGSCRHSSRVRPACGEVLPR